MLTGGFNQRRVDALVNIVRDPRIVRDDTDRQINSLLGFATTDHRLNEGSSCIGCHADGMNRANNDLGDWLDEDPDQLPASEDGADSWTDDEDVVARVRELYPPSGEMRDLIEQDRRMFIEAMAEIKRGMVLGIDKDVYVEPHHLDDRVCPGRVPVSADRLELGIAASFVATSEKNRQVTARSPDHTA